MLSKKHTHGPIVLQAILGLWGASAKVFPPPPSWIRQYMVNCHTSSTLVAIDMQKQHINNTPSVV